MSELSEQLKKYTTAFQQCDVDTMIEVMECAKEPDALSRAIGMWHQEHDDPEVLAVIGDLVAEMAQKFRRKDSHRTVELLTLEEALKQSPCAYVATYGGNLYCVYEVPSHSGLFCHYDVASYDIHTACSYDELVKVIPYDAYAEQWHCDQKKLLDLWKQQEGANS